MTVNYFGLQYFTTAILVYPNIPTLSMVCSSVVSQAMMMPTLSLSTVCC